MYLNLPLAIFWLALGSFLIVRHWLHPDAQDWTLFGTTISVGWLCLLMALYNMVRWWTTRSYRAQRQALEKEREQHWDREEKRRQEGTPPDPNFQFNETPPPTEER